MSAPPPAHAESGPRFGLPRDFVVTAVVGSVVIAITLILISNGRASSDVTETLGTLVCFGFVLFTTFACARAARRRDRYFRAWTFLTLALLLFSAGSATAILSAWIAGRGRPLPAVADYLYLAGAVPSLAALIAMPRLRESRGERWRLVLDGLVITLGVLFLSWLTVLQSVVTTFGIHDRPGRVLTAFCVVAVIVYSTVLLLGMRARTGEHVVWGLFGGGFAALTVTASVYLGLLARGTPNLGSHQVILGWMIAPLSVILATMVRPGPQPTHGPAASVDVGLEFLPNVPVLVVFLLIAVNGFQPGPFLVATGALLLICLVVRQLMILLDNAALTRNLRNKVLELARVGSIVTSSRDAIVGVAVDGQITSFNPAAERLFGLPAALLSGSQSDAVTPDQMQGLHRMIQSVQSGELVQTFETEWVRPDGSKVQIGLAVSPILDDGVFQGVSISGQDITERTLVAASLVQAREDALESSRLKSEFLATMSHEIRTPMNGVIGLTGLLLETPLSQVQRQYAEGVNTAGEALLAVINDVLDFSKLEAGKITLELVDFSIRKLVEEVGSLLAPAAAAKKLELLAYCLPTMPDVLRGDAGRIRQILLNLASNAVKFTGSGEVAIKVAVCETVGQQVRVRFEVADTGIGLAEDGRAMLFQAFSQADASTTRRYGGTGLGLAISSRLVQAMQGRIDLDSEEGVGSTFWFEIPLTLGLPDDTDRPDLTHRHLVGTRIIVVDDHATSRQIVAAQLTAWRAQPDVAEDAAQALSLMRRMASDHLPYDIAVIDLGLPDVDGLELAASIIADPALRTTRMILLTPTLHVDRGRIQRAGVGEWLAKPVRTTELYDRLLRLVGPATEPSREVAPDPGVRIPGAGSLGRILVVEDNSLNQLVAEGMVSRLGYQVNIVANGLQALEALSSTSYSAVLMDCHMPIMDGFEATREIRRRTDLNSSIPIIAMTAGAMVEDRERCLAAGMDDYVSKPIDLQAVGELLRKWVPTDPEPDVEPPIDPQRLAALRELGSFDDVSLLSAVVDLFLHQAPASLAEIREAVRAGAAQDLKEGAHALRGAADNIGATRVAGLCLELEQRADTQDEDTTSRLLGELGVELDRACRALEQALLLSP